MSQGAQQVAHTSSPHLSRQLGMWAIVGLGLGYMTPMTVFDTFGIVSGETPLKAFWGNRSDTRSRTTALAHSKYPGFMYSNHFRRRRLPSHRVAHPTMSGWTMAGMPRHTLSSATTTNPQARINSAVGRLQ